MSITINQVQQVLANAKNNDETLRAIQQAANTKGLNLKEPAEIAAAIGTLLAGRSVAEQTIIATMVDSFKAAAYAMLVKSGERFPDGRHDNLISTWNKTVEALKAAQSQNNSGSLLGGGNNSGSLLGGGNNNNTGSSILGNSAGQGILVQDVPLVVNADTNTGQSGISMSSGAATSSILAPAAPQPQANAFVGTSQQIVPDNSHNDVVTSLVQTVNDNPNTPVINIMDPNMESYDQHELVVQTEHTTKSAKKANSDVKLYRESDDWRTPLAKIFNGESTLVYYEDADICVRMNEVSNSYLVGMAESDFEMVRTFFENHRDAMGRLRTLSDIEDVEKLIETVMSIIKQLGNGAKKLHEQVNDGKFSTVTFAAETVRFVNSYLYLVDVLTHNAIALVTNRGTNLPTGKTVTLERKAEDLEYFAENVYAATTGANGISEHEDWFRDLFLTVGVSLRKLMVNMDGNGQALTTTASIATIVIPGNYASVDKDNHVSINALGATSEPVTEIYEEFYAQAAHVVVMMSLPSKSHLLLSNGEVTSAIRY